MTDTARALEMLAVEIMYIRNSLVRGSDARSMMTLVEKAARRAHDKALSEQPAPESEYERGRRDGAREEREACAKIAIKKRDGLYALVQMERGRVAQDILDAIRARGEG